MLIVSQTLGISFQTVLCWLLVFLASKDNYLHLCVMLVMIIFSLSSLFFIFILLLFTCVLFACVIVLCLSGFRLVCMYCWLLTMSCVGQSATTRTQCASLRTSTTRTQCASLRTSTTRTYCVSLRSSTTRTQCVSLKSSTTLTQYVSLRSSSTRTTSGRLGRCFSS